MGGCGNGGGPDGDALVVLGAAVAIQMAQNRSADEIELLSAFFEVLGDNLALIAARRVEAAAVEARRAVSGSLEARGADRSTG